MKKLPSRTHFDEKKTFQVAQRIPNAFRALYIKVLEGRASPRQVIKAKCQECMGHEAVYTRVRECPSSGCPLWLMRPYQIKRILNKDVKV